jgi:hypothetical protein
VLSDAETAKNNMRALLKAIKTNQIDAAAAGAAKYVPSTTARMFMNKTDAWSLGLNSSS